ncbi:MAG TPA: hypothetical protein VKA43_04500 [Gammaproteobacteria bacterium]|nr:hypothetical protein [Gammaproteobacteria bacterium]
MAERLTAHLQAALADFAKWLEETQIPATIIGGIAASILGRPRLTRDIDALAILPEAEWGKAIQSAARLDAHAEADVADARRWIREFATASGMPYMLEEFDKLLERRERRQ